MQTKITILGLLLVSGFAGSLKAETIFLTDGQEVIGKILEKTAMAVVIEEEGSGRRRSIRMNEIELILKDAPKPLAAPEKTTPPLPPPKKDEPSQQEKTAKEGEGGKLAEKKGDEKTKTKDGEGDKKEEGKGPDAVASGGTEGAKDAGAGEAGGEGKKDGAKEEFEGPKLSEEKKRAFEEALPLLESQNPSERASGLEQIRALGKDTAGELVKGLNHRDAEARSSCASMLGEFGAQNAIKHLIETFYSALPDKGQAATYQRGFVRSLKTALEQTTGQSFISVEPSSPLVQEGVQKYVEWYNANMDRLPPQIGEKKIAATDPDYQKKILENRKLNLQKKEWPRPPLPADMASGTKEGEEGTAGRASNDLKTFERSGDKYFKSSIPSSDRTSAGGVVREADKKFSKDFFNR